MIGQLRGIIIFVGSDHILLDVGGVGYVVHCGQQLLSLFEEGMEQTVIIETIVREDAITLYGFKGQQEKLLFNNLITVQGVGARIALTIVSEMQVFEVLDAIGGENYKAFLRISGIGEKTARRIVNELKNKKFIKEIVTTARQITTTTVGSNESPGEPHNSGVFLLAADVVSALVNLGFPRSRSQEAVAKALEENPGADFEKVLRNSLNKINNGG